MGKLWQQLFARHHYASAIVVVISDPGKNCLGLITADLAANARSRTTSASPGYNPLIHLALAELPQAADLVGRQLLTGDPLVNGIGLHAKIGRDLVHRQPTIFVHRDPATTRL
jgi:hypothetical protein